MKKTSTSRHLKLTIVLLLGILVLSYPLQTIQAKNTQMTKSKAVEGWSEDIPISQIDGYSSSEPDITSSNNNVHIVWSDANGSGYLGSFLWYTKSKDNGSSWEKTNLSVRGGAPHIVTNNDNLHIVFKGQSSFGVDVYYKRSLDNGDSWQQDVLLSEDDGEMSANAQIAVSGNSIHVVWQDEKDYGWWDQCEIYYKRSTTNGESWDDGQGNIGAVRRLTYDSADSATPVIAVDGSIIHVVWGDSRSGNYEAWYMRSENNGKNWTEPKNITSLDGVNSGVRCIAVSDGKVYVVGTDSKWEASSYRHFRVWLLKSEDNGESWNQSIMVDHSLTHYYCGEPNIKVKGDEIFLVWDDNRSGIMNLWYKYSTDDCGSWSEDSQITYSDVGGGYPKLALGGSMLHVVWQDSRTGNSEVFYKRSPGFASNIFLTANPSSLPVDGISTSIITATVTNKSSSPMQGLTVNFNIEAGSGTLLQPNNITDANGTAATTFVAGTVAGNVIINVSCNSIWNKTTITLISSRIKEIKMIPEGPINLYVNDLQQFTAIAHDQYGNINTSWQPYWHVDGNVGTINDTGFFAATKKGSGIVNCTDNVTGVYNISIINILNSAPVIEFIENQTTYEGQLFTLQINATDPDDDILAFSDNSTLFNINSTTGLISFIPSYDSAGYCLINITVTDGVATLWQTFKLTVLNVNREPIFTQIDDQTGYEGQSFSLQINATDLDGDTLIFSDNSSLFDINSTTGLISFIPDYDSAGTYYINVTVTDGEDLVWRTFKLTIINVNRAPTAIITSPTDNAEFTTKDNILFDATGSSDPDNDDLTYSWTSSIDGDIGSTASLSKKLSKGTHTITLTVDDGNGGTDTKQITITVNKPSGPSGGFIPGFEIAILLISVGLGGILLLLRKRKT